MTAAEAVHGTMATLSQQLRRFLGDKALLENRRIMEILRSIEAHAFHLRQSPPPDAVATVGERRCAVELPMNRRLYRRRCASLWTMQSRSEARRVTMRPRLYSLSVIDRAELLEHIASTLEEHREVTLRELTTLRPLRHGLAELITYLDLGSSRFDLVLLNFLRDTISWQRETDGGEVERQVTMQRILFKEKSA